MAQRVNSPNLILQTTVLVNSNLAAKKYDDLMHLPLDEPPFSLQLWVLTHKDLRHCAMVKVFMQHLADSLGHELN